MRSLALVCLAAAALAASAAGRTTGACNVASRERTTAMIDGNLYGMIRSTHGRYLFGWSGDPVLSVTDAIKLIRALGVKGTLQQIADLVFNTPQIVGGDYADSGATADFFLTCPGTYRATVVVRRGKIPWPTRIWLQQGADPVRRAYCMPALVLPLGARLSVEFTAPLNAPPPTYTVDRDANGTPDGHGAFRSGGKNAPFSQRC